MTHVPMTPSQRKTLRKVLRDGIKRHFLLPFYTELSWWNPQKVGRHINEVDGRRHEFKNIEIKDVEGKFLSVTVEIGMTNDENTLASIYCRHRIHVLIGKRGGMTTYRSRRQGEGHSIRLEGSWVLRQGWEH